MSEWQPIETAPKDGTVIHASSANHDWPEAILWQVYSEEIAEKVGEPGYWRLADENLADIAEVVIEWFTHWMPLPAPPHEAKEMEMADTALVGDMTLGDLIAVLESSDPDMPVVYDWAEPSSPSRPENYAGAYSDLTFPPTSTAITVKELLHEAKEAVGKSFKGPHSNGYYGMHSDTPIWAAANGSQSGVAISGAKVIAGRLVLITEQIEWPY